MKKRRLIFLAIAFATISLASFVLLGFVPDIVTRKLSVPPPLTDVQTILAERTKYGLDQTSAFMEQALEGKLNQSFAGLSTTVGKELNEQGLAIFIFQDDELSFWTENIDVSSVPEESVKLVFVQNTWCISYWLSGENVKGLLLVKVKYDYPYQNQFLKNQYHSSLSFLKDFRISPIALRGAFPVTIFNNTVFYLNHIPQFFEEECNGFSAILSWTGFLSLLLAVYILFWIPFFRKYGIFSTLLLIIVMGVARLSTLHWQFLPQAEWKLFSPEIFAYSWIYPSLGDFLVNSLIIFAIASYVYRNFSFGFFKISGFAYKLLVVFLGAVNFALIFYTDHLFSTLILNSTIVLEAYQIFNLSLFSLIGYLIYCIKSKSQLLSVHFIY